MSENTTILLRQEDRLEYGLRTVEWVAFSKIKAIIEYSRSLNNEPVYWGGARYLSEIMPECKHTCAKILEQLVEKGALLKFYSVVGNDLQWSQIYYLARDYPEDKPHPLEGTIHEISSRPSPDKVANLAVMRKQGKWHMELGGIPKTDTPRIPKDATPSAQKACIPHVENCPGGDDAEPHSRAFLEDLGRNDHLRQRPPVRRHERRCPRTNQGPQNPWRPPRPDHWHTGTPLPVLIRRGPAPTPRRERGTPHRGPSAMAGS